MGPLWQRKQIQPMAPLLEGPDPEMLEEGNKRERSWDVIREWFRLHKGGVHGSSSSSFCVSPYGTVLPKGKDLRLLLGVLGCPLAPIPLLLDSLRPLNLKDVPIKETSAARYIIQQYLAATGCLNKQQVKCSRTNMYTTGEVKMIYCETEISAGKNNVKSLGTKSVENGCFVLWQMSPGMWSLELVVGGSKVVAGSDGRIVWRHTPWLGTHAAKGPQRPLRRIIQGLDPKQTACLFGKAQYMGESTIGDEDCFILRVEADRTAVKERSEGPAEVIRHTLCGYFSQKSGLLIYLEDSHLTRVETPQGNDNDDSVYLETTIGSSISDYRDVDGLMIAHRGRTIATVFKFGEESTEYSRTRLEEVWTINDVEFNVPGLSIDYFIPPADIFHET